MALALANLVRIGTAFNRTLWIYRSTTDTIATVQGSGYFNGAASVLAVADWIMAVGSDGAAPLYVVTNSGGTVTTAAGTSGSAVSIALLDISAGTIRTIEADDALVSRDLVAFHSVDAAGPRVDYADHLSPLLRHKLRSGRYYGGMISNPGVTTTFAVSANTMYALPFVLYRKTTFSAISAQVTSLHASNMRMGIYADLDGLPGGLVLDAGEVSAGSTGVKDISVSLTLDPGVYWLASVYAGTPTMRAAGFHTAAANLPDIAGILGIGTPGTFDTRVSASLTYGALPASFGAVTYAAGESPGHWLKVA